MRLLIIEDESLLADRLAATCRERGYVVDVAADGEQGDLREGHRQKIEGDHPTEVQPLVDDLNGLLEDRERAVARALATAGDLAHGLKTPLAVLAQEAEEADKAGHHDLGATLRQLVERMQRQVDYHLARARATPPRAAPAERCAVLPSVEGLVRTMRRLHAERRLTVDVDVSPAHQIRGRREDLDEMLGNLLDNACKWARSRVAVSSANAAWLRTGTCTSEHAVKIASCDSAAGYRAARAWPRACGAACSTAPLHATGCPRTRRGRR
jgi:signal transduction histidine kinase